MELTETNDTSCVDEVGEGQEVTQFHICNHKLSFISVCVFFFHATDLEGGKKTSRHITEVGQRHLVTQSLITTNGPACQELPSACRDSKVSELGDKKQTNSQLLSGGAEFRTARQDTLGRCRSFFPRSHLIYAALPPSQEVVSPADAPQEHDRGSHPD